MRKIVKYPLIILSIIIVFLFAAVFFDIMNAWIFNKSPIISKYESLGKIGYVDRGLIFDVFYCNHSADVVYVEWKLRGFKYTCPDNTDEGMINKVGNVFVKTYIVEKIEDIDGEDYQHWTLSQDNGSVKETVKVPILSEKIKIGKKYEIIFRIKSNKIKNDIKSVFENAEIINISETSKDVNQIIW